MITMD